MTKTGLEKLIEDLVAEQEYWNGRNSSVADRIGRLLHIARSLLADEQVQKPLINASLVEELKYYCKTLKCPHDDRRVSTVPYAIGRATAKKEILNILSKYTPVSAEPVESFLRTFAKDYVGPIIMLNGISGESLAKRIVDCLSSESKAREFLNKQEDVNGGAGKILRRKP